MQIIVHIHGREALPVRALPFAGRWGWMTSPDGIAFACSQQPTKSFQTNNQFGTTTIPVRNTEALPSFVMENGLVREMLPSEWSFCTDELECLKLKKKGEEHSEGENFAVWRRQAIEKLPAGVFVWLDDFVRWFSLTRPDALNIEESEHPAITVRPSVSLDLEAVVMEGFDEDALRKVFAKPPYQPLESALDEKDYDSNLNDLPASIQNRISFPWDAINPAQRRDAVKQRDYLDDPNTENERGRDWDLRCRRFSLERDIRSWEILKPQSITEKIAQSDRLHALRGQARLLQAQLSGDAVVSLQEEQAQAPSEAEAAIAESAVPQSAKRKPGRKPSNAPILLEGILNALKDFATSINEPFDRNAMPGPLGENCQEDGSFHWLCGSLYSEFVRTKKHFATQRNGKSGVGKCALAPWAGKNPSNFYRRALPVIASKLKEKQTEPYSKKNKNKPH